MGVYQRGQRTPLENSRWEKMSLKTPVEPLRASLEATYQALLKFSVGGFFHGTYRDLMNELGLQSPAPLTVRLNALTAMGIIIPA